MTPAPSHIGMRKSPEAPIAVVLRALEAAGFKPRKSGKGWKAHVPGREDQHPSLSVNVGPDRRVLVKDMAGKVDFARIAAALNLEQSAFFPLSQREGNGKRSRSRRTTQHQETEGSSVRVFDSIDAAIAGTWRGWKAVDRHEYTDSFVVVRRERGKDKRVVPYVLTSAGWAQQFPSGLRPLYREREALAQSGNVYLHEGEKCCNLSWSIGVPAIACSGGKDSARSSDWSRLKGRTVIVVPDHIDGDALVNDVAAIGAEIGFTVKVLRLPDLQNEGDDIEQFIETRRADGKDDAAIAREIIDLAAQAPLCGIQVVAPGSQIAPAFKSARDLLADHPCLRPPVITGILRKGEIANLIAPSKTGKSWLVILIAISVASGRSLFDRYEVDRGDILILDNELHAETIANRLPRVAEAIVLEPSEWVDHVFIDNLRGRLVDLYEMERYFSAIDTDRFKVIILDAFYRFIPKDADENDNGEIANMYNLLDRMAARLGCAFILIHHSSKGLQSEKAVTDVGSGAGSQSRAADTHLILRHHEELNVVVLDAAVRSWPPIEPFCLRWDFPVWKPALELDPTKLRKAKRSQRKKADDAAKPPAAEPWTVDRFIRSFVTGEPEDKKVIVQRARIAGVSNREAEGLIAVGLNGKQIFKWTFQGDRRVLLANRSQEIFETISPDVSHARASPHTPRGTPERPRGRGNSARVRKSGKGLK